MKILNFKKPVSNKSYLSTSILGINFKLNISYAKISNVELSKKTNEIDLILPKSYKNSDNMDIINLSIQKLYDKISGAEIENSMEFARHLLKFAPEDYVIKRLNHSFYKCAKNKVLIINPDIVQYSREIINTTVLKAFCKIKYKDGSKAYKEALSLAMQKYEKCKSKIQLEEMILKVS